MNQREMEVDTPSFSAALRASLRQDPDVILVGEMRDMETIGTALHAAETDHMVFSTLHTLECLFIGQRRILGLILVCGKPVTEVEELHR